MNTIFKTLFNSLRGRIFGEFESLNTDIHPDIKKIVKVTKDKTLDGNMFKFKLDPIDLDIYVIRELNDFIYMDTLFVDNRRSVVCSIPYDLYNYEQKSIAKVVKSLYTYICTQLVTRTGDTIYNKIIAFAPIVLTIHTLRDICTDLSIFDYLNEDDEFKQITADVMYDSLSYSIEELLDYCGIIALYDERIKKEFKNEEQSD